MRRLLPLLALLAACDSAPTQGTALRLGGLEYSVSDAAGRLVLQGHLDLQLQDASDSTVSGNWEIAWVPGADTTAAVGPQVGTGHFTGSWHGDRLAINLNPTSADNNVMLLATPTANGYAGAWQWVGFVGPITTGSFVAAFGSGPVH